MKKQMTASMLIFVGFFLSSFAFAEEVGTGVKGKPTLVATPDGGVIVLFGSKLSKFDGQLNLIKEVELKSEPDPGAVVHPAVEPVVLPPIQEVPPLEPGDPGAVVDADSGVPLPDPDMGPENGQ